MATGFKRDLTSEPAEKIHAELRHLHLPNLNDIREEFEEKVRVLGVGATS